jgi:hypothetical protein
MKAKIIGLNHEALDYVKKLEEVDYNDPNIPRAIEFKNEMTKIDGFEPRVWKQEDVYWWEVYDHISVTPENQFKVFTALRPYESGRRENINNYFSWVRNLNMPEGHINWDKGWFNEGVKL